MCQHTRFIRNQYDGRSYLVNCGHCAACLQEKNNIHLSRINLESQSGKLCAFVTLSYENTYVPYVLKSNVVSFLENPLSNTIDVLRNGKIEHSYNFEDLCDSNGKLSKDWSLDLKFLRYKRNNGSYGVLNDRVGVLYLRDVQLFIKRLKIRLFRLGYKGYFSYYYATEYGEQFNRPHIHILFYFDKEFYSQFKSAVASCWPYADLLKLRKQSNGTFRESFEIAKNPAKYVSSYVNCRSYVPSFLSECKPFKPFRRFSVHFGCNFAEFSLPKVLEKVYSGNLRYSIKVYTNGVSSISQLRIPNFVLSRYFPKFKGYRHLSAAEIIYYLQRPSEIFRNKELSLVYSYADLNDIYNSLLRINSRFFKSNYYYDWLYAYPSALSLSSSESLKDSYKDCLCPDDIFTHFDNIKDYYLGDVQSPFLMQFNLPSRVFFDPNDFPSRVAKTEKLTRLYSDAVKHHRIKSIFYEKSSF